MQTDNSRINYLIFIKKFILYRYFQVKRLGIKIAQYDLENAINCGGTKWKT